MKFQLLLDLLKKYTETISIVGSLSGLAIGLIWPSKIKELVKKFNRRKIAESSSVGHAQRRDTKQVIPYHRTSGIFDNFSVKLIRANAFIIAFQILMYTVLLSSVAITAIKLILNISK